MGWIDKILAKKSKAAPTNQRVLPELQAVQEVLTSVDADKLDFVAGLALLMARVAGADFVISDGEKTRIAEILQKEAQLSNADAITVTNIVSAQELSLEIEHSRITSLLNEVASLEEKLEVIRALFYVACDEDISEVESEKIRSVSKALHLSNGQFIRLRSEFSEYRSLLKNQRNSR